MPYSYYFIAGIDEPQRLEEFHRAEGYLLRAEDRPGIGQAVSLHSTSYFNSMKEYEERKGDLMTLLLKGREEGLRALEEKLGSANFPVGLLEVSASVGEIMELDEKIPEKFHMGVVFKWEH